MDVKTAYNDWSKQYDSNINKTRDLEAKALREVLTNIHFDKCLEIGCGTGKNTEWLLTKAEQITAVDFSEEMLAAAKSKINSDKVEFVLADITQNWDFVKDKYDLITFSLVLEHIENINHIFNEVSKVIHKKGIVYIGELHPFKQYSGSKARFETENGIHILECFTHNISDFVKTAENYGLRVKNINEYFDDDDRATIPRVLTLLFEKH